MRHEPSHALFLHNHDGVYGGRDCLPGVGGDCFGVLWADLRVGDSLVSPASGVVFEGAGALSVVSGTSSGMTLSAGPSFEDAGESVAAAGVSGPASVL